MKKIIIDLLSKFTSCEPVTYSDSDPGLSEFTEALDTCGVCGYTGEEFEVCPQCGANYVENAK